MPVHKRGEIGAAGSGIKIMVLHGSHHLDVIVPAHSTFGELKGAISEKTGLKPDEQKLLFRGKEKNDEDYLHMSGVKDQSKVILKENPASEEPNLAQMKEQPVVSEACKAVYSVRAEVDKLSEKVSGLALAAEEGAKISEKDFVVLPELLMRQLLKLDSIEAEGEAKAQRRNEVRRVQSLVDTLDALKVRNDDPSSARTKRENFDSVPPPREAAPSITTQDWVQFD